MNWKNDAHNAEVLRLKEEAETAQRMQRVADGHVSSLEAHIRAIRRVASAHYPTCNGCKTILDVIEGKVNIFAPEEPKKPIEVVAAVRRQIRSNGNKYWVCRRTDDGSYSDLAGMWEYPGGRVEKDETYKDALRREMREEFGVEITFDEKEPLCSIVSIIPGYNETVNVTFFAVTFRSEPELRVHDEAKWCTLGELELDNHLGAEFNKHLLQGLFQ